MPINKKSKIKTVTFSYIGKDADFEVFLKAMVRDYLAADNIAKIPSNNFIQKVGSVSTEKVPLAIEERM